jgi:hypothetical protein
MCSLFLEYPQSFFERTFPTPSASGRSLKELTAFLGWHLILGPLFGAPIMLVEATMIIACGFTLRAVEPRSYACFRAMGNQASMG